MCLYYDLVFVLKGIRTWMCKQCFTYIEYMEVCVLCIAHDNIRNFVCVAFVWVAIL